MGRTGWFVLLVPSLVAVALAATASAQQQVVLPESGVEVRAWSIWPDEVDRGYVPLKVGFTNPSEREVSIDLKADTKDFGAGNESFRTVHLAPGEERTIDLLLPGQPSTNHFWSQQSYRLEVEGPGKDEHTFHGLQTIGRGSYPMHAGIVLTERELTSGLLEEWVKGTHQNTWNWGGTDYYDVSLSNVLFSDAPANPLAYTSLEVVLVETADQPPEDVLEPILSWVRLGGTVAFFGPDAERVARRAPGVAAWLEPRFQQFEEDGVRGYAMGLGSVYLSESSSLFGEPAQLEAIQQLFGVPTGTVPDADTSRAEHNWAPRIPDLTALPYRTVIVLLVLFALLIGPVNFILVRSSGKPALLLVTIPMLALLVSVGVLVFGVFHQGIDVKSASLTLSVLDQRDHRVGTVERRTIYAGISQGAGLVPGTGTGVFAHPKGNSQREGGFFLASSQGSLLLSGDYMPVRIVAGQTILSERAGRGRIELRRDGDGWIAENGLGVQVRHLWARDSAGRWFVSHESVGEGESSRLVGMQTPAGSPSQRLRRDVGIPRMLRSMVRNDAGDPDLSEALELSDDLLDEHMQEIELPPDCYYALVRENPFTDNGGVETNEKAGWHGVLGVLATDSLSTDGGER